MLFLNVYSISCIYKFKIHLEIDSLDCFPPQSYSEWLRGFEKKAKECVAGASGAEEVKVCSGVELSVLQASRNEEGAAAGLCVLRKTVTHCCKMVISGGIL